MKRIVFVIILLNSFNVFGQTKNTPYYKLVDEGDNLLKEKKINIAIDKYKQAWKIDSTKIEVNYGLGLAYLNDCRYNHKNCKISLYYFNKSFKINKNYKYTYYDIGICKMLLGDYTGALNYLNIATNKKPNDTDCYINRAIVYIKLNNRKKACLDLQKGISLGSKASKKISDDICK